MIRSGRAQSGILVLPVLATMTVLPLARLSSQTVDVPHDYAIVAEATVARAKQELIRLRDRIILSVAQAGLTAEGYPRPCHIESHPDPERPGAFRLDCVVRPAIATEPTGILFDADGHFMQLSVVAELQSRLYLAEVYLVPSLPYEDLATYRLRGPPRVVLHPPIIADSWHPAFWMALQRGIEAAGARVIDAR